MKKILAFGFFITSFISLAIFISAAGAASVAHADPAGTMDGSSCDFNGQGTGSGMMSGGKCVATSAYVSQSGFTALAPIPGLTDVQTTGSVLNGNTLALFFNNLYKYLIGLAATLAVIEIVWAGLDISFFHKDAVSAIVDDKGRIYNAVFGLILVLSPVLVFSIINPSILNLSLNLPPIKLDIPAGGAGGGGTTSPATDPGTVAATTTGCTITGTLLKTAICPTQVAAQAFAASCSTGNGDVPFFTTDHKATCGTNSGSAVGPFSFYNMNSTGWTTAIITQTLGFADYQPVSNINGNSNNGSAVLQFASTCTADGGSVCMPDNFFASGMPCLSNVTTNSSKICWSIPLYCEIPTISLTDYVCTSNPKFTVVNP
jgi:hypothetical protein